MELSFESPSEREAPFSPASVRQAVDRILASAHFQRSPALSRLLSFLVEHQLKGGGDLKETFVGHALYGRPVTYDPKADSVVRVNATRLRSRLTRYYQDHPEEKLQIELNPGSYIPLFRTISAPQSPSLKLLSIALDLPANRTDKPEAATSVEHPPSAPEAPPVVPSSRRPFLWLGIAAFAALIAAGIIFRLRMRAPHPTAPTQDAWALERVSSLGGEEEFPTLSPDGRTLAFVWRGNTGNVAHIFLEDQATGYVHRLTDQQPEENRPAWSPDGNRIAFVRLRDGVSKDVVIRTLHDGSERRLTELTGAYPWLCEIPRLSWSHDAHTLYSSASQAPNEACSVVAIDVQRGNVRRITQPPIGTVGDLEPAVAPDGSGVAFLRNAGAMGGDVFLVRTSTGVVERLTFDNRDVMGFSWMPPGGALLLASRRGNGVSRLWQMGPKPGKAFPLTDGSMTAGFPSVSADGDRILFTAYRGSTSIWKMQDGELQQLINSPGINYGPHLSADGKRLVYRSDRTGAAELWMSRLDGSSDVRLTYFNGPMVGAPRWAPDGSAILFECRPRGQSQICLVKPDGQGNPQVLTHWSANQIFPSWSHDGKSFYFTSNDSGRWEIYRQASGAEPVQLTHSGGMRAIESPDGAWLYISRGEPQGGIVRLALNQSAASAGKRVLQPVPSDVGPEGAGNWDVSNDGIVFVHVTRGSIVVRDVNGDTGRARQIATLKTAPPSGDITFSFSPQTGAIVFVKAERSDGEIDMLRRQPARP